MDNKHYRNVLARINKTKSKRWNDSSDVCCWLLQVGMGDVKPENIKPLSAAPEAQAYRALVEIETLRAEVARLRPFESQFRYWWNKLKKLQSSIRYVFKATWQYDTDKKRPIWSEDLQEFLNLHLANEYDNVENSYSSGKDEKAKRKAEQVS